MFSGVFAREPLCWCVHSNRDGLALLQNIVGEELSGSDQWWVLGRSLLFADRRS